METDDDLKTRIEPDLNTIGVQSSRDSAVSSTAGSGTFAVRCPHCSEMQTYSVERKLPALRCVDCRRGFNLLDDNAEASFTAFDRFKPIDQLGRYGFLRSPTNNYVREKTDPFVPGTMVEKFGLRQGVMLHTMVQQAKRQQGPRVREILDVEGTPPENYPEMPLFDDLTAINPEEFLKLEKGKMPLTNRVIDLLAPMGKGQRALIVAPPRSGKTVMLQHIAEGVSQNHPDLKLMVLLIDERPEEVTDMRRSIVNGEVIASSLDMDIESHVRLSQLAIDRAKRLAEAGQDVFLMLDSITRLARAFNKYVGKSGRGGATGTGGLDIRAMDVPKKLFATARAFQEGGSLTIIGTCLVDTNSRMDEAIFQEFKGTGNMEVVLDRRLADRRVYPSIDISMSGTRREELLHDEETYETVTMLRRTLSEMHPVDAMEQLTKQLGRFEDNEGFLKLISGAKLA